MRLKTRASTAPRILIVQEQAMTDHVKSRTDANAHQLRSWIDRRHADAMRQSHDEVAAAEMFDEILDQFESHLGPGVNSVRPDELLPLLEHVAELVSGFADPNSFVPTPLDAIANRLRIVHHSICARLGWSSERLAEYLVRLALLPIGSFITNIAVNYADILGREGMVCVRSHVLRQLAGIRERPAGDDEPLTEHEERILDLADSFASDPDGFDVYIDARTRYRPGLAQLLSAINICVNHRRYDRAIPLIDEALQVFRDILSPADINNLRIQLIAGGRRDAAVELAWRLFNEGNPGYYLPFLRETVGDSWSTSPWRERALESLRRRTVPDAESHGGRSAQFIGRSALIRTLLLEGAVDEAWQEALDHDCSKRQWLELADALAPTRPDDAVAVYQAHVEALEPRTSASAYEELIGVLRRTRDTLHRHGRIDEFYLYLAELKQHLSRRRKLVRMIESEFGQMGESTRIDT